MEAWEQIVMGEVLVKTECKSQLCPQASRNRASHTALREKVSAMAMSVTCGERLQDVSENLDRAGSSVKIRPVYSQEKISNILGESYPTLPRWGIMLAGEFGALTTLGPPTKEIESSYWLGTPTASMTKRSARFKRKTLTPAEFVEKFPTPLASDVIRVRYSEKSLQSVGKRRLSKEYTGAGPNLSEYVAVRPGEFSPDGGKLNPAWVEWLQGVPIGWTELDV